MPSPNRFRKKSSRSSVSSGAATSIATTAGTTNRLCFHQGCFLGEAAGASTTGSKAVQMSSPMSTSSSVMITPAPHPAVWHRTSMPLPSGRCRNASPSDCPP